MFAADAYPDINAVWNAFERSLAAPNGIILYAPVFVDYIYQGLQSFYDDNVQYIEIRTSLAAVRLLFATLAVSNERAVYLHVNRVARDASDICIQNASFNCRSRSLPLDASHVGHTCPWPGRIYFTSFNLFA